MLDLDTYEVVLQADVLTNIGGIHALTAWRLYNRGAVVEQKIEELAQLSAGKTAVDDTDGNALLWSLAVIAYQTLHTLRENFLSGSWRTAQPKRLRLWLFRLPAKLTRHARKTISSSFATNPSATAFSPPCGHSTTPSRSRPPPEPSPATTHTPGRSPILPPVSPGLAPAPPPTP